MSDSELEAAGPRNIEPHVAALLAVAGQPHPFTLEPLQGGRNNRTYRVRAGANDFLLKWYFAHHSDDRDRLGTEFDFGSFLWRHGLRQIARPLAADRAAGLGLYEFLPGRLLAAGDVTLEHHRQAIAFLQRMNALRSEPDASSLPEASEACFSLAEHVERIDRRLRRLAAIDAHGAIDREMAEFIRSKLQPVFGQQRTELEQWAAGEKLDLHAELTTGDRCLSPSDFGFHNALLPSDGSLRFVDFEYAGWDDPAKLVGDFFCQIEVPAVGRGFNDFLDGLAPLSRHPESFVQRARRLLPFYQVKWCCIVLNDFLPVGEARRSFSEPRAAEIRRSEQLAVARRQFERIGCVPGSSS